MPVDSLRSKVLYGIGAARGTWHRYTVARWVVGVAFTLGIALLPLTDTLRFDLWGGHHHVLGEEVDFVTAAKRFAFLFLAVNVAIVLVSRFLGRWLCGFVCPWGSLSRLAEWFRFRDHRRGARAWRTLSVLGVCLLLGAITFSFWVDWRVFREGSPLAVVLSGGFLAAVTLGLWLGISRMGLRFCRELCPSGVYFAVLGPETTTGIEFAHPESCTDCKACIKVCPMDLQPKDMLAVPRPGAGLYPDGMSQHALCIRCGDCVVACEETTVRDPSLTPLRLGFLARAGVQEEVRERAERAPGGPSDGR